MSLEDAPRPHRLTPIGDELTRGGEIPTTGPSWRDRLRDRPQPLPTPTTRRGALAVALARLAVGVAVASGVTLLIAVLGGWTHEAALSKTFMIVGAVMVAPIVLGVFGNGRGRARAVYARTLSSRERSNQVAFALVGVCLFAIGLYLNARR